MKLITICAFGLVLYPWAGAEGCGGLQTTVTLPADGAGDVLRNTRVFTGGFGPGAFGPGSVGVPLIVPELWGPSGQVSVTVESAGDGRAWWAILTPTAPLEPATTYEVRSGAHVESRFTTGTEFDAKAPAPVTVTVAADASDPCTQTTCGWSSLLEVMVSPVDAEEFYRVYVRVPPETTAHLAGVMAAALATRPWGVGTATAYNNAAAFPILQPSTGTMFAEALVGATVCVSVEALDLAGNTSGLSAEACGVLPDPRPEACSAAQTPPDAPTSTTTPSSSTEATLDTTTETTTPGSSGGCTAGRAGPRQGVTLAMLILIALRGRRFRRVRPGRRGLRGCRPPRRALARVRRRLRERRASLSGRAGALNNGSPGLGAPRWRQHGRRRARGVALAGGSPESTAVRLGCVGDGRVPVRVVRPGLLRLTVRGGWERSGRPNGPYIQ